MSSSPPSIDEMLRALPKILAELQALRAENAEIRKQLRYDNYDPEKLRTIAETADYLGTTPGAVKALVNRSELYAVRIGNYDHIAQSQIRAWLEREHTAQENNRYKQNLAEKGS